MGVRNGKGSREPRACKEADLREIRGLLYSTGTSAQYYVKPKWGKNLKKNRYMYMYH